MGRINYERVRPVSSAEHGMKLDAIRELLSRLGNPHQRLRIIHVAGTKGKGSTGAMLAAALEAAGLTTGVYSSPHLDRLEERFAVSGSPCSAREFVALVARVRPLAEAMDAELASGPTFFDLTTAMALDHFDRRNADAVVLEVGLGGRFDSTNVVTPIVSVITSISLDHTKLLGTTCAQIAAEKAGILKHRVPAISGVVDLDAARVIEAIAQERSCPLWQRDRDFRIDSRDGTHEFVRRCTDGTTESIGPILPALPGTAQLQNAAVALATLGLLADRSWELPIESRRQGIATGKLPGRLERFAGDPVVIIDGAHNDASAAALADALDALCGETPREQRVLVIAISDDKDVRAIIKPLANRFGQVVTTRFLENPRASDPNELAAVAREFVSTDRLNVATTPSEAYHRAKQQAGLGGAIVFAGSLLFAAEARRLVVADREGRSE